MMKYLSLLLLFLLPGLSSQAQAPKYSNEFLSIGTGARAKAMGNSFVAIADDATAGYWNPAGLLRVKSDLQLSLMHAEYFAGIAKYDFGAVAFPIDTMSTIGFTYIRFGVDDIPTHIPIVIGSSRNSCSNCFLKNSLKQADVASQYLKNC